MPKYWVKNYFAHGSFPEVGQKQKTEKEKKRRRRLNDGDNNGQATHGARKHAWRTQAAWAKMGPPNARNYNIRELSGNEQGLVWLIVQLINLQISTWFFNWSFYPES